MTANEKKKLNKKVGAKGEKKAARYLRRNGYKIIARNVEMSHGELDIIAEKDKYIVFVEVKTRQDNVFIERYGRPARAVDAEKRYHLVSAANEYIKKNKINLWPRGDVIEVYVTEKGKLFKHKAYRIEHLTNMFGSKDRYYHKKK